MISPPFGLYQSPALADNVLQIPEVAFYWYKTILIPLSQNRNLKHWQFEWSETEPGDLLLNDVFDEFNGCFHKVHGRTFEILKKK